MNLLKGSLFLKLAALVVAILTYFFIHNEINSMDKENAADPSYKLLKLTATTLPVKVRLDPALPTGYRVQTDQVVVEPTVITVIGPEALFEDPQVAETSMLDVSEYTKPVTKRVPLESVAGVHVTGEPLQVTVTVPIEKIPVPAAEVAPVLASTPEPAAVPAATETTASPAT